MTAALISKCPCWLRHSRLKHMFVCCFQFLFGSAHVMKQPGFRQACEVAFAECGGAVKPYIVEQEVLWSIISYSYLPSLHVGLTLTRSSFCVPLNSVTRFCPICYPELEWGWGNLLIDLTKHLFPSVFLLLEFCLILLQFDWC